MIALAFSFWLLAFSSCKKGEQWDCVKSTGKIVQEERSTGAFEVLYVEDNVNVILTNDSTDKIIVEAGDNLLKKIKTEINGNTLVISNKNKCNWVRSFKKEIKVYLGIKKAKGIFHAGYGDITSEELLQKDTIVIHHYSSGNIHLKLNANSIWADMDRLGNFTLEGQTNGLVMISYGLGKMDTRNLISTESYVTNKAQGECHVYSNNILGVEIKNDGNVYYYGNPASVDFIKNGKGSLIKGD